MTNVVSNLHSDITIRVIDFNTPIDQLTSGTPVIIGPRSRQTEVDTLLRNPFREHFPRPTPPLPLRPIPSMRERDEYAIALESAGIPFCSFYGGSSRPVMNFGTHKTGRHWVSLPAIGALSQFLHQNMAEALSDISELDSRNVVQQKMAARFRSFANQMASRRLGELKFNEASQPQRLIDENERDYEIRVWSMPLLFGEYRAIPNISRALTFSVGLQGPSNMNHVLESIYAL